MTKTIELTRGKVAIVDDDMHEYLMQWKWYAAANKNTFYAVGKQGLLMHRLIMNAPKGLSVDHRDGNGLNNQRENLRLCTNAQNHFNQKLNKNSLVGFKGVRRSRSGSFRVRIILDGREIYLGTYATPEEAARAYDAKAMELFGEFARLNFPAEVA